MVLNILVSPSDEVHTTSMPCFLASDIIYSLAALTSVAVNLLSVPKNASKKDGAFGEIG